MTMYVRVREERYPLATVGSLSLWDLMDMQKETGMSPQRLEECLMDLTTVGTRDARFARPEDVLGSPDHLMAMAVQIWVARRASGERITVREASDVPMDQWTIEGDEEEPSEEPDPTGPGEPDDAPSDT